MGTNQYKPLAFWSWNGAIEPEELCTQIADFHRLGYGGFFIHSRAGLKIPYFGEKWFACCRTACEEAGHLGMDVYLYDEEGWPSGFSGGRVPAMGEEYQQKGLYFSDTYPASGQLLAVYKKCGDARYERIPVDGENGDLFAYYVCNPSYADITSLKAVNVFLETTHDRYYRELSEYFGTVICGIFTDEPQLAASTYHWSFELEKEYFNKTGRNFFEDAWCIPFSFARSEDVRHDYWQCISQLVKRNYSDLIGNWCESHGISLTGHFACEDGLLMQVSANAGVMPQYSSFQIPGIDHLGRRYAPLPLLKQVQSIARQTGKKQVLSESFGCSGWNLSFRDMTGIWGWQAINGINTPCIHLSFYSIEGSRKRDNPPAFSYQCPWWEQFGEVTRWMTHVNRFLAESERFSDILVLTPLHAIWRMPLFERNDESQRISAEFRRLLENLRNLQLDPDLGDETMLSQIGSVNGDRFRVGDADYRLVIIPETPYLEPETIVLLKQFAENGGKVLCINFALPEFRLVPMVMNNPKSLGQCFDILEWERPVMMKSTNGHEFLPDVHLYVGENAGNWHIAAFGTQSGDGCRQALLYIKGYCRLYQVDVLTGEQTECNTFSCNGHTMAPVVLRDEQMLLWITEPGEPRQLLPAVKKTSWYYLRDFTMERLSENALNIDFLSYSFDDEPFSENVSLFQFQKELKKRILMEQKDRKVLIRYDFDSCLTVGTPLALAMESADVSKAVLNDTELPLAADFWYMDKAIKRFDITGLTKQGKNHLTLQYEIPASAKMVSEHSFESEINRFCPAVEPESVYIVGDFDVETNGTIDLLPDCISVKQPRFCLIPSKPKAFGELTTQGNWFYRGTVRYTAALPPLREYTRCRLAVDGFYGTLVTVSVNGSPPQSLFAVPSETDITEWLQPDKNFLTLTLYGTNRNLLGPHHHKSGELYFVGTDSFTGVANWADRFIPSLAVSDTWTDDYFFVRFGIHSVKLIADCIC